MKEILSEKTYKKSDLRFSAIRYSRLIAGRKSRYPLSHSHCQSWRYSSMPLFKRQTCQISRSFIRVVHLTI